MININYKLKRGLWRLSAAILLVEIHTAATPDDWTGSIGLPFAILLIVLIPTFDIMAGAVQLIGSLSVRWQSRGGDPE